MLGTIPQLQVGLHPGKCEQEPLGTFSCGAKENGGVIARFNADLAQQSVLLAVEPRKMEA